MALSLALQSIPLSIASLYLESNILPDYLPSFLFNNSIEIPLKTSYGGVIIVNVVLSGLYLVILGFKVGSARKKYTEKAIKDGEENAEQRYNLPNLYADGNTENARLFNCVQRGHQQALETYPQFLAFSLIGGLRFPIFTTINGLLWIYARAKWAEGYATGNPNNRYSHWASRGIWHSLIFGICAATGTAFGLLRII
mmetsp:Transcript_24208/g.24821  ORF Transcript_24208/g.24821 Transcript_24208/m.24821 type:complete len:197 (-) Transcript_24208:96-686(-)